MPNILNTSLSGMLAFQRALDVTSHNIANANTPGYTRQVPNFVSRVGSGEGTAYVGSGTRIASIERKFDQLQNEQLRSSTSGFERLNTLSALTGRIDTLLADADTGLTSSLQSYYSSLQDLTNDPSSIPTRLAVLGEAEGIESRFRLLSENLQGLEAEVSDRLTLAVDDVNRIAASIAEVNQQITQANGSGSQPNDLLDRRDGLVLELSAQVATSTIVQDDGSLSVFIGSGQSLVLGGEARQLAVTGSEFDATRATVVYQGASGNTPLDTSTTGGNLGGLLDFRSSILESARQSLGQTAVALTVRMNEQHAAGMDLRGNLGGDLFTTAPPTVQYSASNAGGATAAATITDVTQLTGADYVLEFDGSNYSLTRNDNGDVISLSGSGSVADPLTADGLSIVIAGTPAAGDRMMIRSAIDAAGSIESALSDPESFAIAAPTRSSASLGNIGSGSISAATVSDSSAANLLISSTIEFTSPTTYSINGAGSFTYTDGDPIVINGSSVTISGSPGVGDQFTIEANFGASGDNSNGLLLAAVQTLGTLEAGAVSVADNYARLVSNVGATTYQVRANQESQGVVLRNAENAVLSTSGVNLDEEAANLIRFQQAYQAAAQVVSVANSLFDSLINATRR